MRVCYFGTYERNYPLNSIIIKGLKKNGIEVVECHVSLWEKHRNKHGDFLKVFSLVRLSASLAIAYLKLGFKFLREYKDIDTVIIGYIGQLDIFWLKFLTLFCKNKPKIIFVPLVSLYDTAIIDRGLSSKNNLFSKLLFYIDKFSFKMADIIIFDTNEHINYISNLFNLNRSKFKRVWVGADEDVFCPIEFKSPKQSCHPELVSRSASNIGLTDFKSPGQTIKKIGKVCGNRRQILKQVQNDKKEKLYANRQYDANNKFTVLFFGKYIPLHGLEYIIKAAKLIENEKDIKFRMIGNGQLYDKIIKLSDDLDVKNIEFIEWVEYDKLVDEINKADVVLGIFGGTEKSLRVIPNKVFQAVACKKPVITGNSPAIKELFADKENILLCENRNSKSLANAILNLKNNKEFTSKIANNSYAFFEKELNSASIGKKMLGFIKSI